jgi:2-C-methyl-D-erythritol 2,4-cyclodiphosphate synthase
LLARVFDLIQKESYGIVNLDCTVILEAPKVNPHIPQMQQIIASILDLDTSEISIKATTHEKVDSFGEKRAIKAYAVALLYKR